MRAPRSIVLLALFFAALAAGVGVFVASERPDGLERALIDLRIVGAEDGDAEGGSARGARVRRAGLALLGAVAAGGAALAAGRMLRRPPGRRP